VIASRSVGRSGSESGPLFFPSGLGREFPGRRQALDADRPPVAAGRADLGHRHCDRDPVGRVPDRGVSLRRSVPARGMAQLRLHLGGAGGVFGGFVAAHASSPRCGCFRSVAAAASQRDVGESLNVPESRESPRLSVCVLGNLIDKLFNISLAV